MTQISAKPRPRKKNEESDNTSSRTNASPPVTRPSAAESKRKKRMRHNATIKLTRRLHLYFGLILVPFVLLYGVTAILFNHQTWFSSSTTEAADTSLFSGITFQDPEASRCR